MSSLLPSFEYDIFISYRHKDNKGAHWVTEFVKSLKTELEATFKEDISIYFDENPHDGLLETHNVDKSLEGKLKCLIFIPILSQTYCDPNSFAWQHEFCAFNKIASADRFGIDVKLSNGNVTSRILPVRIHDLDADDHEAVKKETKGSLRAIEFIYKEAGVNRPLCNDDDRGENLNKTRYRNQVNKVANAIKEIITGLKNFYRPVATKTSEKTQWHEFQTPVTAKSIVVLPFLNISRDPEQEYFCDGITEELINSLSQIGDLRVIARTSSFTFKNQINSASEIGNKLNVGFLLEGSVQKSGNKIRITTTLIQTDNQSHVWSAKFDKELADIFTIQDEIASSIQRQLSLVFSIDVERIKTKHSINIDAFNYFLLGKFFFYKGSYHKSIDNFEWALELDPDYSLAHAGIAIAFWWYRFFGDGPPELVSKIEKSARQALALNPLSADAHAAMALSELNGNWNWKGAEREFLKAIEIDPTSVIALHQLGLFYSNMGLPSRAIYYLQQALRIDPLNAMVNQCLGWCYYLQKQYIKSIQQLSKVLELDPENLPTKLVLIFAWIDSGEINSARSYLDTIDNKSAFVDACHVWLYCLENKKEEAKQLVNQFGLEGRVTPPVFMAWMKVALKEYDKAFDCLEDAIKQKDPMLICLPAFNWWDPIRSDLRLEKIYHRMGLADYLQYDRA